ncbi:BLUF domain-containing protein [Psychrosphaera sp. 1_MG-2023]|uniref:BLUF domain-containing protein n=1 Tax=Psychrosphaera sp. 1_MG-2023 TaxID=3062643 RepID=UPI0026E29D15|nr:BLUF domain-containing protein [Psychrosphaera sp. 1_MG-2023]MDO6718949.1 BLUF domain-containing protein [Psychrosphaera sp. 1_MG-2023]
MKNNENLRVIVYVSELTSDVAIIDKTLKDIITSANRFNEEHKIYGALFYHNQRFLQLIEGEHDKLSLLMDKLYADTRHTNLKVVVDAPIGVRTYEDWTLDLFNLNENQKIDFDHIITIKKMFDAQCKMDGWLFVQTIKDYINLT